MLNQCVEFFIDVPARSGRRVRKKLTGSVRWSFCSNPFLSWFCAKGKCFAQFYVGCIVNVFVQVGFWNSVF